MGGYEETTEWRLLRNLGRLNYAGIAWIGGPMSAHAKKARDMATEDAAESTYSVPERCSRPQS